MLIQPRIKNDNRRLPRLLRVVFTDSKRFTSLKLLDIVTQQKYNIYRSYKESRRFSGKTEEKIKVKTPTPSDMWDCTRREHTSSSVSITDTLYPRTLQFSPLPGEMSSSSIPGHPSLTRHEVSVTYRPDPTLELRGVSPRPKCSILLLVSFVNDLRFIQGP